jgi:hypothetical protein
VETDFSRFDGTHSHAFYKHLELRLLKRAFNPADHPTLLNVHRQMTEAQARTSWGVKYNPDGSRASGAADTSVMNTVDNAYVAYCVFRKMGYSPEEAWAALGLYGGDDGITPDADPAVYEKVCADLGLSLKAKRSDPNLPCTFLGRVFPRPAASPANMADLPRQLGKVHLHHAPRVPDPGLALYGKAVGHLLFDPNTPVLAAWGRMILRLFPHHRPATVPEHYLSYVARENVQGIDPQLIPSEEVMMEVATQVLGVEASVIRAYESHLASITSISQLQPLRSVPVELPPTGTVLGGELIIRPTPLPILAKRDEEHKPSPLSLYPRVKAPEKKTQVAPQVRSPRRDRFDEKRGPRVSEDSKRTGVPDKPQCVTKTGPCRSALCPFNHSAACFLFSKGACTYGDNCKFRHEKTPLRKP